MVEALQQAFHLNYHYKSWPQREQVFTGQGLFIGDMASPSRGTRQGYRRTGLMLSSSTLFEAQPLMPSSSTNAASISPGG